ESGDRGFHFFQLGGDAGGHDLRLAAGDQHVVFQTHADAFVFLEGGADGGDELFVLRGLGKVIERVQAEIKTRLNRDHHAGLQFTAVGIVHVQTDAVTDSVVEPD